MPKRRIYRDFVKNTRANVLEEGFTKAAKSLPLCNPLLIAVYPDYTAIVDRLGDQQQFTCDTTGAIQNASCTIPV